MGIIANGDISTRPPREVFRRTAGVHIRQEKRPPYRSAGRNYPLPGIGDAKSWSEADKQAS